MTATQSSPQPAIPDWLKLLIALGLVIGLGAGAGSLPTAPTPSTTTVAATTTVKPTTTSTTIKSNPNLPVWRRKAAEFGTHPRQAEYAARFYQNAALDGPGKISTVFEDYSIPNYDIRTATTTMRIFKAGFGFPGSIANGSVIPWNPNWKPGTGNDRIMVLTNPGAATTVQGFPVASGEEIDLWTLYLPGQSEQSTCFTLENLLLNPGTSTYLCAGGFDIIQDQNGNPVDYRTATTTYPTGGGYFAQLPMAVTPDDIRSGVIAHAMDLTAWNTMFGPACTPTQLSDITQAGETCGYFENPASRIEWTTAPQPCGSFTLPNTVAGRSKTIPEGLRIYLSITDAQIEQWLDSKGYTGNLRNTARIFAVAWRDYGAILTNTSCFGGYIRSTGRLGPDKDFWNAQGIPTDPTKANQLMFGVFTPTNIRIAGPSEKVIVGSNLVKR